MEPLFEPKPLYTIPEAARALGVGRTTIYQLISSGELVRVKIGNRAVVTATSMRAFVARLEAGHSPTLAAPDPDEAAGDT